MSGVTPEMLERKEHELYGMRQRRIEELERTMASMKVDAEEGRGREAELRARVDGMEEEARRARERRDAYEAAHASMKRIGGEQQRLLGEASVELARWEQMAREEAARATRVEAFYQQRLAEARAKTERMEAEGASALAGERERHRTEVKMMQIKMTEMEVQSEGERALMRASMDEESERVRRDAERRAEAAEARAAALEARAGRAEEEMREMQRRHEARMVELDTEHSATVRDMEGRLASTADAVSLAESARKQEEAERARLARRVEELLEERGSRLEDVERAQRAMTQMRIEMQAACASERAEHETEVRRLEERGRAMEVMHAEYVTAAEGRAAALASELKSTRTALHEKVEALCALEELLAKAREGPTSAIPESDIGAELEAKGGDHSMEATNGRVASDVVHEAQPTRYQLLAREDNGSPPDEKPSRRPLTSTEDVRRVLGGGGGGGGVDDDGLSTTPVAAAAEFSIDATSTFASIEEEDTMTAVAASGGPRTEKGDVRNILSFMEDLVSPSALSMSGLSGVGAAQSDHEQVGLSPRVTSGSGEEMGNARLSSLEAENAMLRMSIAHMRTEMESIVSAKTDSNEQGRQAETGRRPRCDEPDPRPIQPGAGGGQPRPTVVSPSYRAVRASRESPALDSSRNMAGGRPAADGADDGIAALRALVRGEIDVLMDEVRGLLVSFRIVRPSASRDDAGTKQLSDAEALLAVADTEADCGDAASNSEGLKELEGRRDALMDASNVLRARLHSAVGSGEEEIDGADHRAQGWLDKMPPAVLGAVERELTKLRGDNASLTHQLMGLLRRVETVEADSEAAANVAVVSSADRMLCAAGQPSARPDAVAGRDGPRLPEAVTQMSERPRTTPSAMSPSSRGVVAGDSHQPPSVTRPRSSLALPVAASASRPVQTERSVSPPMSMAVDGSRKEVTAVDRGLGVPVRMSERETLSQREKMRAEQKRRQARAIGHLRQKRRIRNYALREATSPA